MHAAPVMVLNDTDHIALGIAQILGQNNASLITFDRIIDDGNGWTTVSAIASPIQIPITSAEALLVDGLHTGIPGVYYSVSNVQTTANSGNYISNATNTVQNRSTQYETYTLS